MHNVRMSRKPHRSAVQRVSVHPDRGAVGSIALIGGARAEPAGSREPEAHPHDKRTSVARASASEQSAYQCNRRKIFRHIRPYRWPNIPLIMILSYKTWKK